MDAAIDGQSLVRPASVGAALLHATGRDHTSYSMRFESTAKVLAKCNLKYYRTSE